MDLAIYNYEEARKMVKLVKKSASEKSLYVRNLIDIYWKRGLKNSKQRRFTEAASDYEQILVLKPYGVVLTEIEVSPTYFSQFLFCIDKKFCTINS